MTKEPLPRVLVYQDENCDILIDYLTFYGFKVVCTTDNDVIKKLQENNYDICILSHFKSHLPADLKLLHYIRKKTEKVPVIFVSSLFEYFYIVEAFNAGVDDYIVKPYNLEELVCRVKALLRRCGIKVRGIEQTYKIGNYDFYTEENLLKIGEHEIRITPKEGRTLALLCAYNGEVLPKDTLLRSVWKDINFFNKRSLDVHMCHIRSYLEQDKRIRIDTVRGIGYSLIVKEDTQ